MYGPHDVDRACYPVQYRIKCCIGRRLRGALEVREGLHFLLPLITHKDFTECFSYGRYRGVLTDTGTACSHRRTC